MMETEHVNQIFHTYLLKLIRKHSNVQYGAYIQILLKHCEKYIKYNS